MSEELLFKAIGIGKSYPGTVALQDVSMEIRSGEVVGLIGENGAGKSTLLRILAGVERPSSGNMEIRGGAYAPSDPHEANALGVGMVFQEQSLISNLSVGQNIFFGQERRFRRMGVVSWKRVNEEAKRVLEDMRIESIAPDERIVNLDFARRQMVEVAKVFNNAKCCGQEKTLILLDEPTSVLSDVEIDQLFSEIRRLRDSGNSIVFVSHRLKEVMEISDRIYVFKDGRGVGVVDSAEADEARLYEMMVGRATTGEYYHLSRQADPGEGVVLEAKAIGLRGAFKDVSFQLREKEVLGICGVVGSGKEDLCAVICGDQRPSSGELFVDGAVAEFKSPSDALAAGIISIPKERRDEGIVGELSIFENMSLSNLDKYLKNGFISTGEQRRQCGQWIERLRIRCASDVEPVSSLSGGNAQKVVFARVLSCGAKILVLNHPTRGVDVGAKEEIYGIIREITNAGISILLLGDTLDECIGLSSRILVMKDGIVTGEFQAPRHRKPVEVDIVKSMM